MSVETVAAYFCTDVAHEILSAVALTEIRIRAGKPIQLVESGEIKTYGAAISADELRAIALRMMEHSYYSKEHELAEGYFTMRGGMRVGVCGSYTVRPDGTIGLMSIGSMCIRIARQVHGCADTLVREFLSNKLQNLLLISPPGMGKTTLLRDTARTLAIRGYTVGIADERHEIAACIDGVPSFDLGPSVDVVDGLPKRFGMERLIRTMSPQILITDELGNTDDIISVREAVRRGVSLIASAHGQDMDDARCGTLGEMLEEGVFRSLVVLKGMPGQISEIWRKDGKWNVLRSQ